MGSESASSVIVAAVYAMLSLRVVCVRLEGRYERMRQLTGQEHHEFSENPLQTITMDPDIITSSADDSLTRKLRQRAEFFGRLDKGVHAIELLGCISGYILWTFYGGPGWVGYALLLNAVASEFYGRPPKPAERLRRTRNR